MQRKTRLILGILLFIEVGAAIGIVTAQPNGWGSLFSVGWGPGRRQEVPMQVLTVNGQPTSLDIKSFNGLVQVTGNASLNEIQVSATKIIHSNNDSDFNKLFFDVSQTGSQIKIEARRDGGSNFLFDNAAVDIQLNVPPALLAGLTADTGGGEIVLRDLVSPGANLTLSTGSGDINATNLKVAQLNQRTGSGNFHLNNFSGGLQAETGSGDIRLDGRNELREIRFQTGSGEIRANARFIGTSEGSIKTGSGDVVLTLRQDGDKSPGFDIQTGSGDIGGKLPGVTFNRRDKHNVTIPGSPLITVRTGSGDVSVN